MKKTIVLFAAIAAVALIAYGCGAAVSAGAVTDAPAATAAVTEQAAQDATATNDAAPVDTLKGSAADGTLELTLEQLKQFDGKNGNPAYVAVDGVIYDLTDVPAWKNGGHNGYSAGNDLTDIIKNKSPHGVKNLEGKPIVGKLVDG